MITFFLFIIAIVIIFLLSVLSLIIALLWFDREDYNITHPLPPYLMKLFSDYYNKTGNKYIYRKLHILGYLRQVCKKYHFKADYSREGGLLFLGYIAIEESFLKLEYKSYSKNTHPVYTAYSIKLPERFKPYWKKSLRYATLNRRKN